MTMLRTSVEVSKFIPAVLSKIAKRLILVGLVVFLLLEIGLRFFSKLPESPGRRYDLTNEIEGFKTNVALEVESSGERTLDWTEGTKPEGTLRILALGGVATFGVLQNAEDTWWGKIHRALQKDGYQVQTAALGEERLGIVRTVGRASTVIEKIRPDIIIGNFGFDDVIAPPLNYRYDPKAVELANQAAPPRRWKDAVVRFSHLARLLRKMKASGIEGQMQNEIGRKDYYKKAFTFQQTTIFENLKVVESVPRDGEGDPLKEYVDGLGALQQLAKRAGAKLILTGEASLHDSVINRTQESSLLVYIPLESPVEGKASAVRPSPTWVLREMERYAAAAEKFAGEQNIPWLDLNGRVERSLENFFSDVMLTDKGAQKVANELLPLVFSAAKGIAKP
jgi:lysophospholipase L1-like esterase